MASLAEVLEMARCAEVNLEGFANAVSMSDKVLLFATIKMQLAEMIKGLEGLQKN